MTPTIPPFDLARVLVFGDLMLDRYVQGEAARLSPEAPVPVVRVADSHDRPGGAGNVALNIAALGAAVTLVGSAGEDDEATQLQRGLESAGVACAITRLPAYRTTTKLRVLSQRQQLLRLDYEQLLSDDGAALACAAVSRHLSQCDVLLLSDYAKGALARPQSVIEQAHAHGVQVLADPKEPGFSRYHGVDLLTPNLAEFEAEVGHCDSERALLERGRGLIDALSLGALLITRGAQGMTLLPAAGEALHLPARAREVFDVTGAGDTVVGVIGAALAAGASLADAVALANVAAGEVVGRLGAAQVSLPELQRLSGDSPGVGQGVVTPEQLSQAVRECRAHGEKVVFTNGCFDILHPGHVAYLEQAQQWGDRLIVAVNGDASVTRLKGAGRPINAVDRRMAVLAGLGCVDWVVSFDEDTPEFLLARLQPDVLVKGGDYASKQEVVGWQLVEGYGGEVRLTGLLESASTSAIVASIRGDSKC